jgi:Fe-S-cluster containining protein
MPQFPIRRDQLPAGGNLCSYCTARCCRYFAVPIDTPTTWDDFDNIRWFMLHGRVTLYAEDETWYLCVYADCRELRADYRCGIYETRPQICRDYSTNACEYDDRGVHDLLFETPEQIWEYAEAILPPKRTATNGRAANGVTLPIVT